MQENQTDQIEKQPEKKKNSSGWVFGCLSFAIIGFYAMVSIPCFIRAPNKSQYTACMEQLAHVKTGIESYMSEMSDNDKLTVLSVPDAMCHHILPGFDDAAGCKGLVRKRVDGKDAGVCREGTFRFKTNTGYDYGLTAIAKEKTQCKICVTEVTATPAKYDDCLDGKFKCVH